MHLCMTVHMHTEIQTRFIITLKENTYDEILLFLCVHFICIPQKFKKKYSKMKTGLDLVYRYTDVITI